MKPALAKSRATCASIAGARLPQRSRGGPEEEAIHGDARGGALPWSRVRDAEERGLEGPPGGGAPREGRELPLEVAAIDELLRQAHDDGDEDPCNPLDGRLGQRCEGALICPTVREHAPG